MGRLEVPEGDKPADVAEYVTAREIQDEPSFSWWLAYTPQLRCDSVSGVFASQKMFSEIWV